MFGVVVHEDVVALLWVLQEVEDLRDDRHVLFLALPAEIAVDGEAASRLAIVATQVEDGLVVTDTRRTGAEFILGEVEPVFARLEPVPNSTGEISKLSKTIGWPSRSLSGSFAIPATEAKVAIRSRPPTMSWLRA